MPELTSTINVSFDLEQFMFDYTRNIAHGITTTYRGQPINWNDNWDEMFASRYIKFELPKPKRFYTYREIREAIKNERESK